MNLNTKINFLAFFLLFFSSLIVAQEDSRKPVDLRILVDISTGIKTSYPEARYLDGLQLLIDRLPQGSKAGIWSYGKYVNHLVKHASVTPAWRSYAKQQLNTVKHVALHRNIVSVVRKASFYNPKVSGYQRVILLLSGGEINLYSDAVGNQLERQKLLNKMLPKLRSAGFIVHTIAMSDKSDQSLLTTLAKETGGFSFTSVNVESFFSAVLALSQWIQPENYISADDHTVVIDSTVTRFSAQLVGVDEQIKNIITAPTGAEISWLKDKYYSLLEIDRPEPGPWKFSPELSSLSRIYVQGSEDLKLEGLSTTYVVGERARIKLPQAAVVAGQAVDRVEVSLQLNGEPITIQRLSSSEAIEGQFEGLLPSFNEAGLYRLTLTVTGPDYRRTIEQPVQVYPLLKIAVSTAQLDDKKRYLLTIIPEDQDLDLYKSSLIATVTDSAGEWTVRTAKLGKDKHWQLILDDDSVSTEFRVELDFTGITSSGREINFKPKPVVIELRNPVIVNITSNILDSDASPTADIPQSIQDRAAGLSKESSSSIGLLVIAVVCSVFGLALIGFYFRQKITKTAPKNEETEVTTV